MSLKIYTPGHGVFLDSLIMYGLVSALHEGDFEYYVRGLAQIFELNVEDVDLSDIVTTVACTIDKYKEDVITLLADRLKLVQRDPLKKLKTYLDEMADPDVAAQSLKTYLSPGHAQDEGRGAHGKQHVWLPFYPHIGKYFTGEYRYRPKDYGVCPSCIALATLGFYKAALSIRHPPPGVVSHIVILSFEGQASSSLLNKMMTLLRSPDFVQGVLEKASLRTAARILPLSVFIQILLASFTADLLKDLYEAKASWTALSTTFNVVRGGVVQIRGYEEVTVDRYLSSLVHLVLVDERREIKIDPLEKLRTLTERLLREEEPATIEALYRFLNTRASSDLYIASRQIIKTLKEGFGKGFCEELACLIQ